MIFEYGIADAQAETPPIIKNIVVYQPRLASIELTYSNLETGERRTVDEMDEEFERIEKGLSATQWVTDPDPMRKQIRIALDRLQEQERRAQTFGKGKYAPILFVVAITIKDAEQACDMLNQEFGIKTLLVTEESTEAERKEARILGKPGCAYKAVVSVLMLREGWDVPAVSVILLLRKFSSRVYGQQVIGRGLRLNVRDEDIQEICAVIDHEKLKHDWLWEMVGAKVRKNVDQLSLFGDEELPPKRKPQEMTKPDLAITIPEPIEAEEPDFEKELGKIIVESSDYPNWKSVIEGFDYTVETEITKVVIDAVTKRVLDNDKFIETHAPPKDSGEVAAPTETHNVVELANRLKNSILDIARSLLDEEGIGSHELGYFYGVLITHVSSRMLMGKTIGTANLEELRHALNRRHQLAHNFKSRPGLVASIVKYKSEGAHAKE